MRFLFLIHGDAEAEAALTADERRAIVGEHMAYAAMLRERGAYVLGEALSGDAAVVRPGERPLVTDGPFAETKEGVGGFYVVECASRDEALELASHAPVRAPGVAVEVLARRGCLKRSGSRRAEVRHDGEHASMRVAVLREVRASRGSSARASRPSSP